MRKSKRHRWKNLCIRVIATMWLVVTLSLLYKHVEELHSKPTASGIAFQKLDKSTHSSVYRNIYNSGHMDPPGDASLPRCHAVNFTENRPFVNKTEPVSLEALSSMFPEVEFGGMWRPSDCKSRSQLALIIPYRDRERHLKIFLQHIHKFLQKQLIEYQVFVVEQAGSTEFNRGMIRNIGFMEAMGLGNFTCTIFHDIDLLPEDLRNSYHCPDTPTHLCTSIDTRNYVPLAGVIRPDDVNKNKTMYKGAATFGGAVAFSNADFVAVNGYSNLYFGWGAEDDDLRNRVTYTKLTIHRPDFNLSRYTEVPHDKDNRSRFSMPLFSAWWARISTDGINSLIYTLLGVTRHKLYTHVLVDVDKKHYEKRIANLYRGMARYNQKRGRLPKSVLNMTRFYEQKFRS